MAETTWEEFDRSVRSRGCSLLTRIHEFPHAVLVAGCQRSGTTMLARILTDSEEMVKYYFSSRDELDAALILSGRVEHESRGRYCFQTAYIDDCYREYYERDGDFKIIWMIRNPLSVAHSMLYNWRDRFLDHPVGLDGRFGNRRGLHDRIGLCFCELGAAAGATIGIESNLGTAISAFPYFLSDGVLFEDCATVLTGVSVD